MSWRRARHGRFRTAVEARSLTGSVNVLGPLAAREAFARARAVVLPSHHDSFPYVALEAAAAGKPLIATSTGGIPEIFGPFADRLVEPANSHALKAAMERFLADQSQYQRDADALRKYVGKKYSLKRMQKKWVVSMRVHQSLSRLKRSGFVKLHQHQK